MPELKHHFRAGKMNKDLDERLVPNGEYRDAQNIEISVSEGSDVGAVQNIRGNTKIIGKTYNSNSKSITANWGSQFGLTNPVCIGHVLNNETDKIYWFINADEADCIAEYDDNKGVISPVLVDANNILDFTADQYITGINVLEGMLFWTDNKTEPKKIDIEVFKSGCNGDFTTHTKYNGEKITQNLRDLMENCVDRIIEAYPNFLLNSAYRSLELNRMIGGSHDNNTHITGQAIDFRIPEENSSYVFNWCVKNLPEFYELMWAYPERGNKSWIHLSYEKGKNIKSTTNNNLCCPS